MNLYCGCSVTRENLALKEDLAQCNADPDESHADFHQGASWQAKRDEALVQGPNLNLNAVRSFVTCLVFIDFQGSLPVG